MLKLVVPDYISPSYFPAIAAGLRIGAAPGPDDGLRALLAEAGVPADAVDIQPVPGSSEHGTSFGLAAAAALSRGAIDGFWANGHDRL